MRKAVLAGATAVVGVMALAAPVGADTVPRPPDDAPWTCDFVPFTMDFHGRNVTFNGTTTYKMDYFLYSNGNDFILKEYQRKVFSDPVISCGVRIGDETWSFTISIKPPPDRR